MNLTQKDIDNTELLSKKLKLKNHAETVSTALSLTASILEAKKKGGDIMVCNHDGINIIFTIKGI